MLIKLKRIVKDVIAWDIEGKFSRGAWLSFGKRPHSKLQQEGEIIVSLTTIPSRIARVHVCIESILRQSMQPSRIALWLSERQFPNLNCLPYPLLRQKSRGLEIYHCQEEWPHKKLLNSLIMWPNATLITADDDVMYPDNWLEKLYLIHKKIPVTIICHRGRIMSVDSTGVFKKYEDWSTVGDELIQPSHSVFPIGVGGVLYPPNVLHTDVQDSELAKKLCPRSDDIWFKINAYRNGTKCVAVSKEWVMPAEIAGSQVVALHRGNLGGGGNDKQLNDVLRYFKISPHEFCCLNCVDKSQQ